MRARHAEVLEHAQQVFAEHGEVERPFVVVGLTVAARVPGSRLVRAGEELHLRIPVLPPAANAMQEDEEFALARHRQGKARRGTDEDRIHRYSAFAPEMRTARARLSLSFLMYAANSSGELPTTS